MTINHTEALRLYTQAAQQGHPTAQNCLGLCYITGIGDYSSSSSNSSSSSSSRSSSSSSSSNDDDDGVNGNADNNYHSDYHVNDDG